MSSGTKWRDASVEFFVTCIPSGWIYMVEIRCPPTHNSIYRNSEFNTQYVLLGILCYMHLHPRIFKIIS
jgi:hypothetical protein